MINIPPSTAARVSVKPPGLGHLLPSYPQWGSSTGL